MCEKCLYKKNCQFLATHKKVDVEDCTAFESEDEFRAKILKDFADRVKGCSYSFLRLYCSMDVVCEFNNFIDNLAKEMEAT